MSALLLALGAGLIALSVWASRRGGTRARSARLMAGLAPVSPEEALLVGEDRYLAVQGSIDAAEAFDDENHRPLVYRRERVLVREGDTWRELERAVRSVQFFVTSSSASIEVDAELLGDGLVVIERQWEGALPNSSHLDAPLKMLQHPDWSQNLRRTRQHSPRASSWSRSAPSIAGRWWGSSAMGS